MALFLGCDAPLALGDSIHFLNRPRRCPRELCMQYRAPDPSCIFGANRRLRVFCFWAILVLVSSKFASTQFLLFGIVTLSLLLMGPCDAEDRDCPIHTVKSGIQSIHEMSVSHIEQTCTPVQVFSNKQGQALSRAIFIPRTVLASKQACMPMHGSKKP